MKKFLGNPSNTVCPVQKLNRETEDFFLNRFRFSLINVTTFCTDSEKSSLYPPESS